MKLETAVVSVAITCWLCLTIAAGFAEKTMSLIGRDAPRSVYSDGGAGTAFNWLDLSRKKFSCLFLQGDGTRYCGMDFQLGDGFIEGWDLTSYDRLQLDLEYRGSAEQFRIFFRNYEPGLSQPVDAMYHSVLVPLRNGIHRYEIHLDKFEVADWWLENNKLMQTKELYQPQRDNVVHIGFDIHTPLPVGKHHFNIVASAVVAPRMGKAEAGWWALGSLAYFLVIGGIYNYLRLRTRVKQHQDEMFGLLKKLDEVGSESSRFKRLSMYDPLTGLLNRRAAQELVEGFAQQYSLQGTSLVMMDIDHFKTINDTFGHDFGDEVLRRVSEVIRDSLREGDAAVRWGGEEIVIICPKTSSEGAYRVAEKLRSEIKALRFSNETVIVTASFGVANIRQNESFSQALGRADEALYEAKRTGRDRVC